MKIIAVIFFILTKIFCVSQTKPCYQEKRICDNNKIANCYNLVSFDEDTDTYYAKKDSRSLYSGKCVTCYRNGQLKSQISIVNGKQDSVGLEYYESGCLQSEMFYVGGKLDREITFYFDSTNNKAETEFFKSGIRNGIKIQFFNNPSNDTIAYANYKNNLLDGPKKEFYPNNKIHRITEYSAGLQNGSQKTYGNTGKLELDISFKNGKKHGAWNYYFDSGLEAKIENWSEGEKNGEFKELDEKGLILTQEFYKKNIPIEKHIQNYPDGKSKHITIFDKKGNIIEETSFDESGVKTEIIKNKKN
jgi:antitoxin component YwqK of YwqJK toxin-antitoxin module